MECEDSSLVLREQECGEYDAVMYQSTNKETVKLFEMDGEEAVQDSVKGQGVEKFAKSMKLSREAKQQSQEEYQAMLKGQDPEKKEFRCLQDNCNRTFSSLYCLKRHFINIHKEVRRFQCNICDRTFS